MYLYVYVCVSPVLSALYFHTPHNPSHQHGSLFLFFLPNSFPRVALPAVDVSMCVSYLKSSNMFFSFSLLPTDSPTSDSAKSKVSVRTKRQPSQGHW